MRCDTLPRTAGSIGPISTCSTYLYRKSGALNAWFCVDALTCWLVASHDRNAVVKKKRNHDGRLRGGGPGTGEDRDRSDSRGVSGSLPAHHDDHDGRSRWNAPEHARS